MDGMPRVFICHSSADREMAGLLVDLLRSALNLPAEAIRCTSVDGHRLAGGEEIDRALRAEIRNCDVFIGLVSAASIESAYVLFELGARWGTEKHLLPLLSPSADASLLRGPLSGLNALDCSQPANLHQMVHELATLLRLEPEGPAVYQRRIDEILGLVARSTPMTLLPESPSQDKPSSKPPMAEADEYPNADASIQAHCEQQWPDDFSMREYCIDQQERALAELRRGRPADIPQDVFRTIRQKCAAQWPQDVSMRHYCEEEQFKAYRKIQARRDPR
jgi:hypothetical protein